MDYYTLTTRECFAGIDRWYIEEARSGRLYVNDIVEFVARKEKDIESMLAGDEDHTFTFKQRLHFLITGISVAFLPSKGE